MCIYGLIMHGFHDSVLLVSGIFIYTITLCCLVTVFRLMSLKTILAHYMPHSAVRFIDTLGEERDGQIMFRRLKSQQQELSSSAHLLAR